MSSEAAPNSRRRFLATNGGAAPPASLSRYGARAASASPTTAHRVGNHPQAAAASDTAHSKALLRTSAARPQTTSRSSHLMLNNRRGTRLSLITVALAMLAAALVPAAPATAAGPIETMPLWRLQVRVTTGDTASAATRGKPAFRFNSSSTGVRTLNPPSVTAFAGGGVDTFDLGLFDNPSQLTMLRIGIAGSDDWCIKKVELIFNQRVAFSQDAVAGGSACATVKAGTYLEYSSAQLRSNRFWANYGTPPAAPSSMTSATLRAMLSSVTGSAMLSSPGVTWDLTKPFTVVRRSQDSLGVSFGVVVRDSANVDSVKETVTYDAQLFVGTDRRLHVRKINPSCCHHGTMSDTAITQLDQALTRMTRVDLGQRVLFSIDANANISWRYVDTNYSTDPNPALRNPERGMYFARLPGAGDSHTIVPEWLWLDGVCGQNLTWNGYNAIGTSKVLNDYAQKLRNYRASGVKVLFRPRYDKLGSNAPSDCTINGARVFHADSKARQINHIDAVAAMLGDHRDVIAYIQAGYLGRWGEWNTEDDRHVDAPLLYSYADRRDLIQHVLSAYAAKNVVQNVELRRPVFAKEVILLNPNANVGLHNDCFMTSTSDSGTYSNFPGSPANFGSSTEAKTWAQWFTDNRSFGGETCPMSTPIERWRSCDNMRSEPAALHMNYLNGDYATDAVSTWTSGGCYDEIRSKLGYRFEVKRVEYTPTVAPGGRFSVTVDIRNGGWARLHKSRNAKLVLRSGSTTYAYPLSASATNTWKPGDTIRISAAAAPPPRGTYSVRLAIPDPHAPDRIPYAVKLASLRGGVNVFDGATGDNKLGVSITVL